jgi:DNA-binding CsgD family transcriptional regulator
VRSTVRFHLSPRQKEIVHLIADGLSDKEIAAELGMSPRTVGSHLARVYVLHDVHKRAQLVAAVLATDRRAGATAETS